MAQGKSGASSAEAYDTEAILSRAWTQSSELASATWGNTLEYVGVQSSMVYMALLGTVAVALLVCTLYVISRITDKDPYLYNKGKLGRLERQSVYNTSKKSC